jgi:hypothetical protein
MDLYQYLCSDDLDYFYVRNNFYIEKSDFVIENNSTEEEYLKNLNEILIKIRCTDQ